MATQAKELEEAKQFLRSRLSAEQAMAKGLSEALLIAANKLLKIYRDYGYTMGDKSALLNPSLVAEVEDVIRKLKDELYEDVELLCESADKSDRDFIIALINESIYGQTLKGRISKWVDDFSTWVMSAALMGKTELSHIPMETGPQHGLERLTRHTIAIAWSQEELRKHPDAVGFYSQRGSSYPCAQCDSMVGWHPISEYPLGGWHPNCMCIFIFTTDNPNEK